ncbi:hypothetical protein DVH24_025302 [Malus domestica]|uniref:Transmembrane protein n=1 Tax=Malus domestica TaxID=3750 RepID=A0A498HRM5_MALDO|nr:hypothetical protein DVH24_025302 [Malus domestica]
MHVSTIDVQRLLLHFSSPFFPSVSIFPRVDHRWTCFRLFFAFASLSLAILNSSFLSPKWRFFSPSNLPSLSEELSTTVQLDPIQFFTQKRWRFLARILLFFFTQTSCPTFD